MHPCFAPRESWPATLGFGVALLGYGLLILL